MRRRAALALLLIGAAPYRLPAPAPPPAATDPAARLTIARCSACHSLDYIDTQPPKQGQAFWAAEVRKMVEVYHAPIPADQAEVIAKHLAATR